MTEEEGVLIAIGIEYIYRIRIVLIIRAIKSINVRFIKNLIRIMELLLSFISIFNTNNLI